jgi:hypothetical protein
MKTTYHLFIKDYRNILCVDAASPVHRDPWARQHTAAGQLSQLLRSCPRAGPSVHPPPLGLHVQDPRQDCPFGDTPQVSRPAFLAVIYVHSVFRVPKGLTHYDEFA